MTGVDHSDPFAHENLQEHQPNERHMAAVAATVNAPPNASAHNPLLADFKFSYNEFRPAKMSDFAVVENVAKLQYAGLRPLGVVDGFMMACLTFAGLQTMSQENVMIRTAVQRMLVKMDMGGYYHAASSIDELYKNEAKEGSFKALVEQLEDEQKQGK